MSIATIKQLQTKSCQPCEGGTPAVSREDAERMLKELEGWKLAEDGESIRRTWGVKNFQAGMDFLHDVGNLAEEEGHHPDVHLTGYRNVAIELTTHAIGGLSENDFILAAKINRLPVRRKGE